MSEPKLHYYSMVFLDNALHASAYFGFTYPNVTRALIEQAKIVAGVGPDAVLLNCSYLGEMTKREFNEG
ncbi:hypothetical protein K6106_18010 [Pseudomonas fluorescens]|nr:hypothetical protein K6106_18010 [Pseudomonas fluorescens]